MGENDGQKNERKLCAALIRETKNSERWENGGSRAYKNKKENTKTVEKMVAESAEGDKFPVFVFAGERSKGW